MVFAVALVVGASAAALFVVYQTGAKIITERERAQVLADRDLLTEVYQEQGQATLAASVARRSRFAAEGERYGLFDAEGAPLAGDILGLDAPLKEMDWPMVRTRGPRPVALHVVATRVPGAGWLVIGHDLSSLRSFQRSVLQGFVAAVLIVGVASLAAAVILNALILQRVDAIATTAERIAAGDLSARTRLSNLHDPFGRVGASLNAMLERIEDLMTGMRTVTDSLAHDLRTPLTRMRSALSRATREGAGESERLDAIEAAQGEVEQTLATLSALLDIARAETGLSRELLAPVDVAKLVETVVDLFAPVFEDAGQAVTVETSAEPVIAPAHEALLRQAVGNLLHNAAQYAGEGAQVRVAVQGAPERVRIIVADTGHGVPADQRGRVVERFVRLDAARPAGGSGLGLAIVAACAKLHGGALLLEDNGPGLRTILEIGR